MSVGQTKVETGASRQSSIRTVALAGAVGSVMEWYDFTLYGAAAALVFGKLFFAASEPSTGTLAALATFGLGFAARPLGGVLFGNLADKLGRTKVLIISLTIMGGSTTLIGLLPTYGQVGVWAPVLLVVLRLLQGLAAGGELGPAATMVAEFAPRERRGFFASLTGSGVALGVTLAAGIFALTQALPEAQFLAWGWRIPFLLSAFILAAGLLIRRSVGETPVFESLKANRRDVAVPATEILRLNPRQLVLAIGARFGEVGPTYIFNTYALTYAATKLSIPKAEATFGVTIAAAVGVVSIPALGALSDRVGRRPVYIGGAVFVGLIAFPFFWLLNTESRSLVWLAFILAIPCGVYSMFAVQTSYFVELFDSPVRVTGISMAREISAPVVAGTAPFLAAGLVAWTGSYWPVSLYIVLLVVVTVISVVLSPETRGKSLDSE